LPSQAEWKTLEGYVGDRAGEKLKSMSGWNNDGNGTDEYGFSALPGGYGRNDNFNGVGYIGMWWSTTGMGDRVRYFEVNIKMRTVVNSDWATRLFSVRCVAD